MVFERLRNESWWTSGLSLSDFTLRWDGCQQGMMGLTLPIREGMDPESLVRCVQEIGLLAAVHNTSVLIAPRIQVEVPQVCYHATPAKNKASIDQEGLKCCNDTGVSTTGWAGARGRIHFSLTAESAKNEWARGQLARFSAAWVVYEVRGSGIDSPFFRDPSSQTGYIIEGGCVAKEFLKVVDTFDNPTTGPQ